MLSNHFTHFNNPEAGDILEEKKIFIDGDFGQIYDQTFIHVYRSE